MNTPTMNTLILHRPEGFPRSFVVSRPSRAKGPLASRPSKRPAPEVIDDTLRELGDRIAALPPEESAALDRYLRDKKVLTERGQED